MPQDTSITKSLTNNTDTLPPAPDSITSGTVLQVVAPDSVSTPAPSDSILKTNTSHKAGPPVATQTPKPKAETNTIKKAKAPALVNTDTFTNKFQKQFDKHNFLYQLKSKKQHVDTALFTIEHATYKNEIYLKPGRQLNNHPSGIWVLIIYSFITLAFIGLQFFNRKYLVYFARSVFNFQLGQKLFNDKGLLIRRVSLILNTIFFFVMALFLYYCNRYYNVVDLHPLPFMQFFYFLIITAGIVGFRLLLAKVTGLLFDAFEIAGEYNFNIMLVNKLLALLILPIIIMISYFPLNNIEIFFGIGFSLIILTYIFKLYKGIKIILQRRLLNMYILLYFCTLEIAPLLIGVKYFINKSILIS